jgi:hypothetical protein
VHRYWFGSPAALDKARPEWLTPDFIASVIVVAAVGYLLYLHFSKKGDGA